MAGGKLSPRQKMINLMYLVFIAMLALNMSKEVLSAFGLLNEKIEKANTDTTARNVAFMESLEVKASEAPEQYSDLLGKAKEVSTASAELDSFLETLKSEAVKGIEDPTDYEVMDKPDFFDRRFFNADKYKKEGQDFIDKIDSYRTSLTTIIGDSLYPDIRKSINDNFSTEKVTNRDGKKVDWLRYNYEGFPLVASLTKLTQIQADIKNTKNELLSKMLAGKTADIASFDKYTTLLEQSKGAYYAGESFDGSIVLGRKDAGTRPNEVKLTLDGRPLTEDQYEIQDGRVVLKVSAGGVGDHEIKGQLIFLQDGEKIPVDVNQKFTTINQPNKATISATKMNVVYRGVVNPMTIAFDGARNVNATAPGLTRKSGSSYEMRPGQGREVTINVTATLPDGSKKSDQQNFRIKDIPRPVGTIRGETGDGGCVRMQRQGLEISSVGAILEDFDFDLNLNVTGFKFKVSGQPTVAVSGRKLDGPAKNALRRAKRGETVQIFDINARIANNSGYKLKKISPVCIELTN
ncbi:gliding motility protein GldM [Aureisphaera galaxeae]|uniref:type IX secretion system motor protein PorM/GldM n=1 Tax=Aureisphaera galaxeae TaxID=1538023 RepID=UPI00235035AC|nr:gliding motility protein GldM [Aureisphaera galaxeae]MDC8003083.1 gliding motility protein GldM [Aureisphaera galaxeae]